MGRQGRSAATISEVSSAIPLLATPSHLPPEAFLNTLENNDSHYKPEFWELWYGTSYRYLKNVSDDALFARHEIVANNFKVFWFEERQKLSIRNVYSAWYWLRKEHLVRYEMKLRGLTPRLTITPEFQTFVAPARPRTPNFGDVFFRFSTTRRIVRTLREGHLWLNAASTLLDRSLGAARADDEIRKTRHLLGGRTRITTQSGQNIPVTGDLTETSERPNYFLLSLSSDYHPYMFEALNGVDACLVIHDAVTFVERTHDALAAAFPSWDFGEMAVHYFDPLEPASSDERPDQFKSKDFSYAFQMEWRLVFVPPAPVSEKHIELFLGPLHDVASLFARPR